MFFDGRKYFSQKMNAKQKVSAEGGMGLLPRWGSEPAHPAKSIQNRGTGLSSEQYCDGRL
jgi:hypothetical protein